MNTRQSEENPYVVSFMDVVDRDNGIGYANNLPKTGMFICVPNSNTKMYYETKSISGARVIFIRYIHFDTKRQLMNLLAFAVQWWRNLRPQMIYMREKDRKNSVGPYLERLGFKKNEVTNNLNPFICNIDGTPCKCSVFEYYAYNIK